MFGMTASVGSGARTTGVGSADGSVDAGAADDAAADGAADDAAADAGALLLAGAEQAPTIRTATRASPASV
jgi:hypothetical protein